MESCNNDFEGNEKCCCNCKFQLELMKHPLNVSNFAKGSILEKIGYVCLNPEVGEGKNAYFFDSKHGMCEMWNKRKE